MHSHTLQLLAVNHVHSYHRTHHLYKHMHIHRYSFPGFTNTGTYKHTHTHTNGQKEPLDFLDTIYTIQTTQAQRSLNIIPLSKTNKIRKTQGSSLPIPPQCPTKPLKMRGITDRSALIAAVPQCTTWDLSFL